MSILSPTITKHIAEGLEPILKRAIYINEMIAVCLTNEDFEVCQQLLSDAAKDYGAAWTPYDLPAVELLNVASRNVAITNLHDNALARLRKAEHSL